MFESKINRGKANGYAPLDGSGKVPLDKLPPIQSTINTGSFVTTGSNIFTGNQIISGSVDTSLTMGELNFLGGPSFGLRVSGSEGAPLVLTSDGTLLIGAIADATDLSGDASIFSNSINGAPVSDGPIAGISVQKSGSFQSAWLFDYDGKSYFPGDINIGYGIDGSGIVYSGSLNITNGDINLTGSLLMTGSIILNGVTYTSLSGNGGTSGESGTSGVDGTSGISGTSGVDGTSGTSILLDSTLTFNDNTIEGNPLIINVPNANGVPIGVANWQGQGGWNEGFYSDIPTTGGTGTGLTVDVAAGGAGYINIEAITINNPGSGYTDGDIITIDNENNLPGTFTISVMASTWEFGDDGILKLNNGFGEIYADDENYSVRIGTAAQNVAPNTQIIIGGDGKSFKIISGPPVIQWDFDYTTGDFNLTGSINGASNLVTTSSFNSYTASVGSINTSSFVTNSQTSSFVTRTLVPTSLAGSEGDIDGMIAFDSGAIYFANETYYGAGPYTTTLYQSTASSPNFPIRKGNFPKPKIGWTINVTDGFIVETITNVVEYTDYWLVYTNGGNSTVTAPANVTLTTNGLLDNVWLKQEFISSSIINSLNIFTGSLRAEINGIEAYTASLKSAGLVSGSLIDSSSYSVVSDNAKTMLLYSNTQDFQSYLLFSNAIAVNSATIAGNNNIRYNSSTNTLTVGTVSATKYLGGVISSSQQITNFGFISSSTSTDVSALNTYTGSNDSVVSRIIQTTSSLNTITGSLVGITNGLMSYTASLKSAAIVSSSTQIQNYFLFAQTSSANTFYGNQTISGSLFVSSTAISNATLLASSSNLTLSSGSNLYIYNGGFADISGSLRLTGSLSVGFSSGSTELQVGSTGVNIGNALTDRHLVTGSLLVTGSMTISSGSITMPNRPGVRVTGAGGSKIAVTALSGSYLNVDWQQSNAWNNSTGTFTAPIAGLYQVNVVVRTNSNTLGTISQLIVYKNNTGGTTGDVQIMIEFGSNTTMNHTGGSTICKLEAGDTLKMVVAVGELSFDVNDNFSVAYIG
jgi:hypothetical protein